MAELVYDCPRCKATKTTFDVRSGFVCGNNGWQKHMEAFSVCRHCNKSTVFVIAEKNHTIVDQIEKAGGLGGYKLSINSLFDVKSFISLKDRATTPPPEHLPEAIRAVFTEGTTCMAVSCFNAAGTMFRLCIDLATKSMLPKEDVHGLNSKIRRNLGLRMPWLFEHDFLPKSLKELAACVKEDGNDGAHEGTLQHADAEDLADFTIALLERLYTEPERVRIANERRLARRQAG